MTLIRRQYLMTSHCGDIKGALDVVMLDLHPLDRRRDEPHNGSTEYADALLVTDQKRLKTFARRSTGRN